MMEILVWMGWQVVILPLVWDPGTGKGGSERESRQNDGTVGIGDMKSRERGKKSPAEKTKGLSPKGCHRGWVKAALSTGV